MVFETKQWCTNKSFKVCGNSHWLGSDAKQRPFSVCFIGVLFLGRWSWRVPSVTERRQSVWQRQNEAESILGRRQTSQGAAGSSMWRDRSSNQAVSDKCTMTKQTHTYMAMPSSPTHIQTAETWKHVYVPISPRPIKAYDKVKTQHLRTAATVTWLLLIIDNLLMFNVSWCPVYADDCRQNLHGPWCIASDQASMKWWALQPIWHSGQIFTTSGNEAHQDVLSDLFTPQTPQSDFRISFIHGLIMFGKSWAAGLNQLNPHECLWRTEQTVSRLASRDTFFMGQNLHKIRVISYPGSHWAGFKAWPENRLLRCVHASDQYVHAASEQASCWGLIQVTQQSQANEFLLFDHFFFTHSYSATFKAHLSSELAYSSNIHWVHLTTKLTLAERLTNSMKYTK